MAEYLPAQGCVEAKPQTNTRSEATSAREAHMRYRRVAVAGASYFFTVVAYQRRPLLAEAQAVRLLEAAIERVRQKRPFTVCWVCASLDPTYGGSET